MKEELTQDGDVESGIRIQVIAKRQPTQEEILEVFEGLNAFWLHDEDPAKPHAELTSGHCSNGYVNCLVPLSHTELSQILAEAHAAKLREWYKGPVDWVIGSPMSGITYAHDFANAIGASRSAFVEKDSNGGFLWNRLQILEGETVLQIEELTTTAKTLLGVREAIDRDNLAPVKWIPYVGVMVHRPPSLIDASYDERKVISLIENEMWSVPQVECHLCKSGSQRYRPKQNWDKLTR